MPFRLRGLAPHPFLPLFGLPEAALAARGILRVTADEPHSYPDRIELRDAEPGETLLLLNHTYLDAAGPYHGRHAIYVREGACTAFDAVDEIPAALARRLLSVRAFDARQMMVDAEVVEGHALRPLIAQMLARADVDFLHIHHARRGCYAARVERLA